MAKGRGHGHGPAFGICVLLGFQCARTASKWTLPPSRGSWLRMLLPPSSWQLLCIVSLARTRDACHEVRGEPCWLVGTEVPGHLWELRGA